MTEPNSTAGASLSGLPARRRADWPGLTAGAVLAAGTIAIYGRTFSVPLLLDDATAILDNPTIRRLWPLWSALSPPHDAGVGGRPLLNLSFALNYAMGGPAVLGYHWVNLFVHVLAGWTLLALVRRTLRRPPLANRFGAAATPLALAVSAIWAWHPVQTESVTYLTQRAESLMGLFYLLTLYGFVRGAEADGGFRRRIWFSLSVLACLAGVGTKEVIVTAPLMVLLYDRTFVSGSFSGAWARHRMLYLALAATWIPLGLLLTSLPDRGMAFGSGIAWWAYAAVECRVVVKYLGLAIWPHPLVFDYGSYAAVSFAAIWPYALVLGSALMAMIVALRRSPALGFGAAWFFLMLAPASSVVPIAGEPMAENRLYLPLAGVAALAVIGAYALAGGRSLPAFAVVAAVLAAAAIRRNQDYSSGQAIWSDTMAKLPGNARAHNNLGHVWLEMPGRLNDAIAEFQTALRLQPDYLEAHDNLGDAWLNLPGRTADAIAEYKEALRLKPDDAVAHNDLANAWLRTPGRLNDAVFQFQALVRLRPGDAVAHYNLGNAWLKIPGRLADAVAEYRTALRLRPDYAEAHYNLGNAWLKLPGRLDDAITEYQAALRLKPDFAEAHNNLGNAWLNSPGRLNDAIAEFEAALRLNPDDAEVHYNLGNAWFGQPGHLPDAIAQYEEAVQLKPDYAEAHNNLGNAWSSVPGRLNDAVAEYERTLRLEPDIAEVHNNLGSALLKLPDRRDDAIAEFEAALRLEPDYAQAHFHLAAALLALPDGRDEAVRHLEAGLRLQPDNQAARQTLDRIRSSAP